MNRSVKDVLSTSEDNKILLNMRANLSLLLYRNHDAQLSEKHLLNATEFLQSNLGWDISEDQVKAILALYPHARIKVAVYDGLNDTEVRELLMCAVADFFLGCDWPTYGDNVDLTVFLQALHKQAVEMGFTH